MNPQIDSQTLLFFQDIAQNNNKEWFDSNKNRWEAAKINYVHFMEKLLERVCNIDDILIKEPKKYLSRINRDTRFTPDKSPYKVYMTSVIERAENEKKCPFYIRIQPDNSLVASGLWEPEPNILKKVRQEIDYNGSAFNEIIEQPNFKRMFGKLSGESLTRPPQGYDASNPHIEMIKLRQYIAQKKFTNEEVLSATFLDQIVDVYQVVVPFIKLLDDVMAE